MKKLVYACIFGALLCSTIVAWFSPQLISWYFTPPADLVISCKAAVEWGIESYRKLVLIAALAGIFIGGAIQFTLQRNAKNKADIKV